MADYTEALRLDVRVNMPTPFRVANNLAEADVRLGTGRPFVLTGTNQRYGLLGTVEIGFMAARTRRTSPVDMPPSGIRSGGSAEAFLVCRGSPSVGNQERVVSLTSTGRPSVTRTQTGTCS